MKELYQISVLLLVITGVFCDGPEVETPLGKTKGLYRKTKNGKTFSAFLGIPFAEAPTGDLRFKDPVAKEAWNGIWIAKTNYSCIQIMPHTDSYENIGQEDCLYVNVFIPRKTPNSKDNLDVVVHIHGGGFMFATQHFYAGPDYLMDKDVVFVTMNYRVGPFGFLSTEDDVVSGNMGLKDQTMALRWIKENIASFGGNPNSVTITGMSAGGASVHYHYLSPLSKGLFHRGFSMSGTALCPWALQEDPLRKTLKLASKVGCANLDKKKNNDIKKVIVCLRTRSAFQINEAVETFYKYKTLPFSPFAPVVEKSDNSGVFINKHPYQLLSEGSVADLPWITSVDKEEGIFPVGYYVNYLDEINKNWNKIMPAMLDYKHTISKVERNEVSEKIKKFYFPGKSLNKKTLPSLIKLNSDRHFFTPAEKAARMQTKVNKSPVWFYMLSYRGEHSLTSFFGTNENYGVSHGDDCLYIFNSVLNDNGKLSKRDTQMKELYLDMVSKFSKSGVATFGNTEWKPMDSSEKLSYLNIISPEKQEIVSTDELYPKDFWKSLNLMENENIVMTNAKEEL